MTVPAILVGGKYEIGWVHARKTQAKNEMRIQLSDSGHDTIAS